MAGAQRSSAGKNRSFHFALIGFFGSVAVNIPRLMTSVKLARPSITAIFILREPPANDMFLGQFGATDSEPRIILVELGLYHGEI